MVERRFRWQDGHTRRAATGLDAALVPFRHIRPDVARPAARDDPRPDEVG
jgi:hypothetical protein